MKGFTFPTNKHNLNQSSSYFKDNKRIPYTKSQNNDHRIRIIYSHTLGSQKTQIKSQPIIQIL